MSLLLAHEASRVREGSVLVLRLGADPQRVLRRPAVEADACVGLLGQDSNTQSAENVEPSWQGGTQRKTRECVRGSRAGRHIKHKCESASHIAVRVLVCIEYYRVGERCCVTRDIVENCSAERKRVDASRRLPGMLDTTTPRTKMSKGSSSRARPRGQYLTTSVLILSNISAEWTMCAPPAKFVSDVFTLVQVKTRWCSCCLTLFFCCCLFLLSILGGEYGHGTAPEKRRKKKKKKQARTMQWYSWQM